MKKAKFLILLPLCLLPLSFLTPLSQNTGVIIASSSSDAKKDLSQYNNMLLPDATFSSQPDKLTLLRLLVTVGWIENDYVNEVTLSNIGVGGNQFTLTAKTWSTQYINGATIKYNVSSSLIDLNSVLPNGSTLSLPVDENLYDMSEQEVNTLLMKKVKQQFPDVNLNQIQISSTTYKTKEVIESEIAEIDFVPISNSSVYFQGGESDINFSIPLVDNTYRYITNDGDTKQETFSSTTLDLSNKNISCIDIKSSILQNLNISNNLLTSLELTRVNNLATLNCNHNDLITLDVTSEENLSDLDVSYNELKNFDINSLANLEKLNVSNNEIASMNFYSNKKLENLDISNNALSELDLMQNEKLAYLKCENNPSLHNIILSIYNTNTDMNNIIPNVEGLPIKTITNFLFASYSTQSRSNYSSFTTRLTTNYEVKSPTIGKYLIIESTDVNANEDEKFEVGDTDVLAKLKRGSTAETAANHISKVFIAPLQETTELPYQFMGYLKYVEEMDLKPLNNIETWGSLSFRGCNKLNIRDFSFAENVQNLSGFRFFDSIYGTPTLKVSQLSGATSMGVSTFSWCDLRWIDFTNCNKDLTFSGREFLSSPGENFKILNLGARSTDDFDGLEWTTSNGSLTGIPWRNKIDDPPARGVAIMGVNRTAMVQKINAAALPKEPKNWTERISYTGRQQINDETTITYTNDSLPKIIDFNERNDITNYNILIPDTTVLNLRNNPIENLTIDNLHPIQNVSISGQTNKTLNLYLGCLYEDEQKITSYNDIPFKNTIVHMVPGSLAKVSGDVLGKITYVYDQ